MSAATITGMYVRDGRWFVIFQHGHMFEHERLGANVLDPDKATAEAVDIAGRRYDIPKAKAERMLKAVQS